MAFSLMTLISFGRMVFQSNDLLVKLYSAKCRLIVRSKFVGKMIFSEPEPFSSKIFLERLMGSKLFFPSTGGTKHKFLNLQRFMSSNVITQFAQILITG
jgi:hypothetical protein